LQDGALMLFGIALGLLAGYFAARASQQRQGYAELDRYANHLILVGEQLAVETDKAVTDVLHDGKPFCSDEDLAFMRKWVYNAQNVRDLGRNRDGNLVCSTGVGRLVGGPRQVQRPDLDTGGMKVYAHSPLMISNQTTGFIVQIADISVVFNPEAYKYLDEPPMLYSAYLHPQNSNQLIHAFGHEMPLSPEEVLRGRRLLRDGVVYRPLCDTHSSVCAVAAVPYATMMVRTRRMIVGYLLLGAVLGGAFALIAVLFYRTRQSLEQQLRRAIRRGSLTVVYQPVFDLSTSAPVGCEALVRWTNEYGEPVRPDRFIALAEEKGFLSDITHLVLKLTVAELGDLLSSSSLRVTVNMATQDLHDPTFLGYLERLLAEANLPASSVGLELTERSTADQDNAIAAIAELQSRGHAVYVDDFGTGYSSLAYLHRLEVHAIKIDRSFTKTIGTEAVTASVIPQILQMARELNLLVVVEGIETPEQVAYFRSATSVRVLGQGFYLSKPMSAADFRKLVQTGNPVIQ